MIGHIAVAYTILKAGVKRAEFKSQFAPNPLNSVIGVYHKQVDAGGSGDGVLEQPVMKKSVNPDELTVLAVSDPLLHLPWAVKRTIPPKVRESIQAALVSMEKSEAGQKILKAAYLSGIGPAEDKDYEPHRRMVKAVMGPQ